jgi:hypothetical protein
MQCELLWRKIIKMSISNVNLRKQIGDLFGFHSGNQDMRNVTQKDIDAKTKRCEELFESMHFCV